MISPQSSFSSYQQHQRSPHHSSSVQYTTTIDNSSSGNITNNSNRYIHGGHDAPSIYTTATYQHHHQKQHHHMTGRSPPTRGIHPPPTDLLPIPSSGAAQQSPYRRMPPTTVNNTTTTTTNPTNPQAVPFAGAGLTTHSGSRSPQRSPAILQSAVYGSIVEDMKRSGSSYEWNAPPPVTATFKSQSPSTTSHYIHTDVSYGSERRGGGRGSSGGRNGSAEYEKYDGNSAVGERREGHDEDGQIINGRDQSDVMSSLAHRFNHSRASTATPPPSTTGNDLVPSSAFVPVEEEAVVPPQQARAGSDEPHRDAQDHRSNSTANVHNNHSIGMSSNGSISPGHHKNFRRLISLFDNGKTTTPTTNNTQEEEETPPATSAGVVDSRAAVASTTTQTSTTAAATSATSHGGLTSPPRVCYISSASQSTTASRSDYGSPTKTASPPRLVPQQYLSGCGRSGSPSSSSSSHLHLMRPPPSAVGCQSPPRGRHGGGGYTSPMQRPTNHQHTKSHHYHSRGSGHGPCVRSQRNKNDERYIHHHQHRDPRSVGGEEERSEDGTTTSIIARTAVTSSINNNNRRGSHTTSGGTSSEEARIPTYAREFLSEENTKEKTTTKKKKKPTTLREVSEYFDLTLADLLTLNPELRKWAAEMEEQQQQQSSSSNSSSATTLSPYDRPIPKGYKLTLRVPTANAENSVSNKSSAGDGTASGSNSNNKTRGGAAQEEEFVRHIRRVTPPPPPEGGHQVLSPPRQHSSQVDEQVAADMRNLMKEKDDYIRACFGDDDLEPQPQVDGSRSQQVRRYQTQMATNDSSKHQNTRGSRASNKKSESCTII